MKKTILCGLISFIFGAGVGYLVAQKLLEEKYATLAQEEIDSVKEVYSRTSAERLAKQLEEASKDLSRSAGDKVKENLGIQSPSVPIHKRTNSYDKVRVAYNEISKDNVRRRFNTESGTADVIPDDEDIEDDESDTIRLVSADTFLDGTSHDKATLYYYTEDDTLVDENGEDIIEDPDTIVGWDCFKVLENQDIVWVRNNRLEMDYEICAVRQSFCDHKKTQRY